MIEDSNKRIVGTLKALAMLVVIFVVLALPFSVNAEEADASNLGMGVVTVKTGGKNIPIAINGKKTAKEIIDQLGMTIDPHDEVLVPLEQKLSDGDTLQIIDREYVYHIEEGTIEHDVKYHYSDEVQPGEEVVVVEGVDGFGKQTFKQLIEDGKMVEQTLVSEDLISSPVTEEIAIGFKSRPTSDLNFEWTFGETREPLNAVNVLKNQRSTAYTSAPTARTASGMQVRVGHVAVNPAVIPYGSKLFIQSSDGNYIYGYAIAADTGGAMLSGKVGVDLYFSTMGECLSYGVKEVDIFVLEEPK